ncbi:MAG: SCP2 sterol-binding domain-containing protein [Pseudomonadota bacterium]
MYPFLSEGWVNELMSELNSNTNYNQLAASWEGPVILSIDKSLKWAWLELLHGKCQSVKSSDVADLKPQTPFEFTADLNTWKSLCEGKLSPTIAIATRKLRVRGDMLQVMRYARATMAMVGSTKVIPTRWIG